MKMSIVKFQTSQDSPSSDESQSLTLSSSSSSSNPMMMDHINSMIECITNMRNTNSFMLMTINRCIDYTKASKGLKLVPKHETIDLLETLSLPLNCMKEIQQRVSIIVLPLPMDICSHIITDKQWLQENVLCLLSNAVKYSNEGEVTLSICRVVSSAHPTHNNHNDGEGGSTSNNSMETENSINDTIANNTIANKSWEEQDYIRIEVEDHGIGMQEEVMQNLFAPFKQAQRLAGGTGLGLFSLAKRIEGLGGECGVQRRRDGAEGSLFWFCIPYRPDHQVAEMKILNSNPSFTLGRSTKSSVSSTMDVMDGLEPKRSVSSMMDNSSISSSDSNNNNSRVRLKDDNEDGGGSSIVTSTITTVPVEKDIDRNENRLDGSNNHNSITKSINHNNNTHNNNNNVNNRKVGSLEILIVDDSPAILKMTSMMLKKHKHKVSTATNGAEAVKNVMDRISNQGNTYDIILMDLQMPVMDGLEATRRLRLMEENKPWMTLSSEDGTSASKSACDAELKDENMNSNGNMIMEKEEIHNMIIGVSANSDAETAQDAYRMGVDAFIAKPFSIETFYNVYERLMKDKLKQQQKNVNK
jgi:CheY-like chemotaxis protein